MTAIKTTQPSGQPGGDRRAAERRAAKRPFEGGDKRAAQRRVLADRRAAKRD